MQHPFLKGTLNLSSFFQLFFWVVGCHFLVLLVLQTVEVDQSLLVLLIVVVVFVQSLLVLLIVVVFVMDLLGEGNDLICPRL